VDRFPLGLLDAVGVLIAASKIAGMMQMNEWFRPEKGLNGNPPEA